MFGNNKNDFLGDVFKGQVQVNPYLGFKKDDIIKTMDRCRQILDSINIIVKEKKNIRDVSEINYQEEYDRFDRAFRESRLTEEDKKFLAIFKSALDMAENELYRALEQKFAFDLAMKQMEEALSSKMTSPGTVGDRN